MTDIPKTSAEQQPRVAPVTPPMPTTHRATAEPTGWVGWILFAGVMLIMLGSFQLIAGFVALFQKSYYVVTQTNNLLVHMNYTSWGVLHICLGGLAVLAGFALMAGQMWARVYAIIVAFVSALSNLAFLSAAPVWCTIMIAVDVLVIWAVAVHGREVKGSF